MDGPGEALVAITAIIVGCWMLVQIFKYGSQALGRIFGAAPGAAPGEEGAGSLTESEVEGMIRRAVREEVRPLKEKIDRIEAPASQQVPTHQKQPRRDLPAGRYDEDPNDFGLIAEDAPAGGERPT